jgi:hypothetical protein
MTQPSAFCSVCGDPLATNSRFCVGCGSPVIVTDIDRFEIRSVLGWSGYGLVLRGYDPVLDRDVAIRQLSDAITDNPAAFTDLRDASATIAGLDHPHCVQIFGLLDTTTPPALIMEYVEGTNAERIVARTQIADNVALAVTAGAIDGLAFLHHHGIVHGNLTPSNVLVALNGIDKLTDIGIRPDLDPTNNHTGFLAPEQLTGHPATAASDVYAIGTLLYYLTTGTPAYPNTNPGPDTRHTLPDVGRLHPAIAELITSCLQPDPTNRPQTATDLATDLNNRATTIFGPDWRPNAIGGLAAVATATATTAGITATAGTAGTAGAAGTAAVAGTATVTAVSTGSGAAVLGGTGVLAALAAKPALIAAAAVATVAVGGGTTYIVTNEADPPPTTITQVATGSPIAWTGNPTLRNVQPASTPTRVSSGGITLTTVSAGGSGTVMNLDGGYEPTACGLTESNLAYCWGSGGRGALGSGETTDASSPTAVAGPLAGQTMSAVAAGKNQSCGVTQQGTAYCWGGLPVTGQTRIPAYLGSGSTDGSAVPLPVSTEGVLAGKKLTDITTWGSTCVLDESGAAYCWGENESGTVGNGTVDPVTEPIAVAGDLRFTSITAAAAQTCGITTDYEAYCWGAINSKPATSTEGFSSVAAVTRVASNGTLSGKTWRTITPGPNSACATDSADDLYCWGAGVVPGAGAGGLNSATGFGEVIENPTKVEIPGGNVASTSIAETFGYPEDLPSPCALSKSGDVYCWAGNDEGVLSEPRRVTVSPGGNSDPVIAIAGGPRETVAIAGGSQSSQQPDSPSVVPAGITYWRSSVEAAALSLRVLKLDGSELHVASTSAACFTGQESGPNTYVGPAPTQDDTVASTRTQTLTLSAPAPGILSYESLTTNPEQTFTDSLTQITQGEADADRGSAATEMLDGCG